MFKTLCRRSLQVFLVLGAVLALWMLAYDVALAVEAPTGGIGSLAQNVTKNFSALAKLVTAGAYIAGFGFILASIFKFKSHKDNPTQIPVGTPIALLFIGAAMVFLPSLIGSAGSTIFGSNATNSGGVSGVSSIKAGGT
jgi:intracellular multiplication protein IcmD